MLRSTAFIALPLAVLLTYGCGSLTTQNRLDVLVALLEPEVALYEEQATTEAQRHHAAVAREVLALLRSEAEPQSTVDQIRSLGPVFRDWLESRGKSPREVEDIIRPIRIALILWEHSEAR